MYNIIIIMSDGVEVVEGSQFGGESSGPIFLDQLHCTGDEESLSECDMYTEPGMHMCGHQHDVGVICQRKIVFCSLRVQKLVYTTFVAFGFWVPLVSC